MRQSDGDPVTFAWDLDNNGSFETPGQNPLFSAVGRDGPGSQTVTVRVCDNRGACTVSPPATVTITNVAPTATFTAPAHVTAGVTFTLALTNPADVSGPDVAAGFTYAFDCGDGVGFGAYGAAATRSCPATATGGRAVKGKVRDKDLGEREYTATVQVQPPSTVAASADTYVRSGAPNTNEGAATFLRLQATGDNRGLVRFSQADLQALVGSGTVVSVKLRLTIADNGNNWGPTGRAVDAHRLTQDWAEGNGFTDGNQPPVRGTGPGATWNCAVDSDISNQTPNCSGATAWEMGMPNQPQLHPWVTAPTASATITNGQSGVVEWDVTADVQAFLSGGASNYGWLIKKAEEGQTGQVSFGAREGASDPVLVVSFIQ